MPIVDADLKDLDRLTKDLETFAKKAIPFAARNSLNATAFLGRKLWARQINKDFILRNKFVTRSLRVVKASGGGRNIQQMRSSMGSIEPFMETQELGGTERGTGKSKPIPTSVAAGQAMGAQPRTKVVRRPNRRDRIRLQSQRRRGKSKRQRNAIAISQAVKAKRRFILLERKGGRLGIARVTGRKRITVRLIWDLSHRSVRVPPTPTLQRTLKRLDPLRPAIARKAIIQQLRFHRVLGF